MMRDGKLTKKKRDKGKGPLPGMDHPPPPPPPSSGQQEQSPVIVPSDNFDDVEPLPEYIRNDPDRTILEATSATSDGRIDVDLNSALGQILSKAIDIPSDIPSSAPPAYHSIQSWKCQLNVLIQVVGSRGDVQPFLALGSELKRSGHRVRIATHDVFKDFVQSSGLEFYPIGGDPAELMAYMVKNPGLIPNLKTLKKGEIQKKRKMIAQMLQGFWKSCIEPDLYTNRPFVANAIIANPPSFAHIHCAQALGIPLHLIFTMPWSPTRAFPHPLANLQYTTTEPRRANYLSYILVQLLTWQGLSDVINKFRKSIDLEDVPMTEGPLIAETLAIPYTYCWSPALIPKPEDWGGHIDVCGFLFRDMPTYTPPEDIDTFLNAGSKPIYIGFGSIVIDDPTALTQLLVEAVKLCGVRAIISKGWSKLGQDVQHEEILFIGDCPHEWLFKQVSAVVHHGGAGTTACGLVNARPTIIVPFFGDQPFWGNMVAAAGAGPSPIPQKQLTVERLVKAIQHALTPEAGVAAERMADQMSKETGVQTAVKAFHTNLNPDVLACDVLPYLPATWTYVKSGKRFKLSGIAAEILQKAGIVKRKRLEPYFAKPIIIENRRWDFLTASSAVQLEMTWDLISALNQAWKAPFDLYRESSKSKETEGLEKRSSNLAADMALSSVMVLPRLVNVSAKALFVDAPLAMTEGLRNMTSLYGDKQPDHRRIVDWKTGAIVAGEEMVTNFGKAITDVVWLPIRDSRKDGMVGFAKGFGRGIGGLILKTTSASTGLIAYPSLGIYKSVYQATHAATQRSVAEARRLEDEWNLQQQDDTIDRLEVIYKFGAMIREAQKQRWWKKTKKSWSISSRAGMTSSESLPSTETGTLSEPSRTTAMQSETFSPTGVVPIELDMQEAHLSETLTGSAVPEVTSPLSQIPTSMSIPRKPVPLRIVSTPALPIAPAIPSPASSIRTTSTESFESPTDDRLALPTNYLAPREEPRSTSK